MTAYADADLVTAIVKRRDHLKARAEARLETDVPRVSHGVGIELLFVARTHGAPCVNFLGAAARRFDIDGIDVLLCAAEALDKGEIKTVFDAVHAATALLADGVLITTDRGLLASAYRTEAW